VHATSATEKRRDQRRNASQAELPLAPSVDRLFRQFCETAGPVSWFGSGRRICQQEGMMNSRLTHAMVLGGFLCLAAAEAGAQVCVKIDEAQDTLTGNERAAAVLLLSRQFATAGQQVVADCSTPILLAHIKLGNLITVTLSGPLGDRQGTALGLEDLPALYDQMVRSLLTGRPMTGLSVVDRTNVTAAQATTAPRVRSDSFTYARLGYGQIFGSQSYGVPSFGFGYRAELDRIALDISFLNLQVGESDYYGSSGSANSASLVKLSGLYLIHRDANSTPYLGGGLSWGRTDINDIQPAEARTGTGPSAVYYYNTGGHGSGLQGELTGGYEFGRVTTIRMFVQADAILPFYSVTSQTISSRGTVSSTTRRYVPSLVMSVGLGWQRNRK
jgi:hypothetical protein